MEDFDIKCYLSDDPNKVNKCRQSCYNIPKYFLNKIALALGLEPRNTPAETCILIDDWARQVKLNLLTQPEEKIHDLINSIESEFLEKLENLNHIEDNKTSHIKLDIKPIISRDSKLKKRKFFGQMFQQSDKLDTKCKNPIEIRDYSFDDIAGMEIVKNQLLSEFIYPSKYTNLFQTTSKGIILYGPPGTGKTSIARAVAAEFKDVAFFEYKAADIIDMYQGQTEKNLESIWKCAKQAIDSGKFKQSIIFIDEFESIGSSREDNKSGSNSTNSTVPTLLQLTAGLESNPGVALFAATNYLNKIDSALLRRFKTKLFLDHPDWKTRKQIILDSLTFFNFDTISKRERQVRLTQDGKLNRETGGNFAELLSIFSMITPDYIDKLANTVADLTGPTEEGLVKMGKVKHTSSPLSFLFGRNRDSIDPFEKGIGVSKYGYSSGDLKNLCDNVINRAGQRALCLKQDSNVGYIQCNHITSTGEIKSYLIYTHYRTKSGDILNPKEYFNVLKSLIRKQGGEIYTNRLVLKLKHSEVLEITDNIIENGKCYTEFQERYLKDGKNVEERVRNFTIFEEDFINLLKTNKPAISNEQYESYLDDKTI